MIFKNNKKVKQYLEIWLRHYSNDSSEDLKYYIGTFNHANRNYLRGIADVLAFNRQCLIKKQRRIRLYKELEYWKGVYQHSSMSILEIYQGSFTYSSSEEEYIIAIADVITYNREFLKRLEDHRGFKIH